MSTVRSQSILFFFFLMIRRPPRSTLFPTRRSSDLLTGDHALLRCGEGRAERAMCPLLAPAPPGISGRAGASSGPMARPDRESTRLNSSHEQNSYAVFCLKKKKTDHRLNRPLWVDRL